MARNNNMVHRTDLIGTVGDSSAFKSFKSKNGNGAGDGTLDQRSFGKDYPANVQSSRGNPTGLGAQKPLDKEGQRHWGHVAIGYSEHATVLASASASR